MALVLADRVKETSTTTGNGVFTLAGAATGFQSFAVIGDGNTTYYCIATQGISEWEVGIGTYASAGTTLTRTTVLSNSSGTQPTALTFSGGTKDVFVTYPSEKSVSLDASGNATALGTPVAFTGTNITGTATSFNINGTVGATTPAAGTFTSLTDSGNLTFTGTGNRITGDFSNATIANRVIFQTSTVNGSTSIEAIPNGTGTNAPLISGNSSDTANTSLISIFANTTESRLQSGLRGTGTYLPLTFYTGGSERARIDTSGNVGIGTSSPASKLHVTTSSTAAYGLISQTPTVGLVAGNSVNMAYITNGRGTNNDGLRFINYRDSTGSGSGNWETESYAIERNIDNAAPMASVRFGLANLRFDTDGAERMRIDSSGNVGIGTSSPLGKLKVTVGDVAPAASGNMNTGVIYEAASGSRAINFGVNNTAGYSWINAAFSNNSGIPDNLVLMTGATERMRIDSSGNVGIGTTSPASKLDVNAMLAGYGGNLTSPVATITGANCATNGGGNLRVFANTSAAADVGGSMVFGGYYSVQVASVDYAEIAGRKQTGQTTGGYLSFSTRADLGDQTERMRIDSSGNVGIGTSSPTVKLDVLGDAKFGATVNTGAGVTTGVASIELGSLRTGDGVAHIDFHGISGGDYQSRAIRSGGVNGALLLTNTGTGSFAIRQEGAGSILFDTTNTERMRIDSSGNVHIGRTAGGAATIGNTFGLSSSGLEYNESVSTNAGGTLALWYMNRQTSTGSIIDFRQATTAVGSITVTASATAYNTSSDYRLKENIAPMVGALDTVAQLKPVTYNWKADGSSSQGFIAHELAEVVPDCVSGEKDAVENYIDEEGNEQTRIKPQGIDTSFLVATLTAAIQEQQALIIQLQADVATLKALSA